MIYLFVKKNYKELYPNEEDINIIKKEIESSNILSNNKKDEKFLEISSLYLYGFKNLREVKKQISDDANKISSIISNYKDEKKITLKILSNEFEKIYKQKISMRKVSKILRWQLNYCYRKTLIKNPRLGEEKYILMTFAFIKGISRCLKLGLKFVFIDETGFSLNNSNLKLWRKPNDNVIGGAKQESKKRINLIMAIDNKEILYGELYTNETIGGDEFLEFLKELVKKLDNNKVDNYVFILDNASYHSVKGIKDFVFEKKLKFFFTIPYKSEYNPIELAFNLIKNHTNNTVNKSLAKLKNQIKSLINDEKINQDINKINKLTMEKYLDFQNNKSKEYALSKFDKKYLNKKRKKIY